ncbi:MAG: hypothetical protein AMXMBFR66_32770 [Pseudomonadota bacterium]|nr:NnrS family protein [Rubrivivax sp.]
MPSQRSTEATSSASDARGQPAPADAAHAWRLTLLAAAPHRLGFVPAALMLALTALWWLAALAAREAGWSVPWAVPPAAAHGLEFALAFMPLFMLGFLFTAGPRWMGLPDHTAAPLVRSVLTMCLGWPFALLGFHLSAALAALGILLVALGWSALVRRFVGLLRASPAADRRHARAAAAAMAVGALAMFVAAASLALGRPDWTRAAVQLAIWGFLAPIFTTVSHRMIPFFTAGVLPAVAAWRPYWLLHLMLGVLAVSALGAAAEVLWWPLPWAVRALLLAVQAPAALLLLWVVWRWGLLPSMKIRLLGMLHGGFLWFGLALALSACSQARMLWLGPEGTLGLAPLHALTMGYLGCTMIAMITRVTAGHSGRALEADNLAWGFYLVLQCAVLLRVAAALWQAGSGVLTLFAIAAWTLGGTGWALRYGNWLGRPRADGRPG